MLNRQGRPIAPRVWLTEAFGAKQNTPIASGILDIQDSAFSWRVTYWESLVVLEGALSLTSGVGKEVHLEHGELALIAPDAEVTYAAPQWARVAYTTYPSDWAQGDESPDQVSISVSKAKGIIT